jgi:hypothetical protein
LQRIGGGTQGYDVIGDIHGHASALESLLTGMGYIRRDGAYTHPERIAIFVGDFVDRGSDNIRACRIVMDMHAAGAAHAIMGNHDFNATCMATLDPDTGEFLRGHSPKNLKQTEKTRAEFEQDPKAAATILAWMKQLPLWLEIEGLRVTHAGWGREAMTALAPYLDSRRALTAEGFLHAGRRSNPVRAAREVFLNGLEVKLPPGISYVDQDGHERSDARLAWWKFGDTELRLREVVYANAEILAQLPDMNLPRQQFLEVDDDPRPIIFGHYWMTAPLDVLSTRHACVDASVARGGMLAAYRFSGESTLARENFIYA